MVSQAKDIFNNHSLYGDYFTQLPPTLWNFTTKKQLALYTEPTRIEGFQRIDETYYPGGAVHTYEKKMILPSILFKYAELGVRRIGGTVLTALTWTILIPIGFSIKVLHLVALSAIHQSSPEKPRAAPASPLFH